VRPLASWGLALAALAAGWLSYDWRGVVLALTVIVFWLLLQFSRALRVLRKAADAPVGQVASAVMLHSKLREGMTLPQVLAITRSLGVRVTEPPPEAPADEVWRWSDAGGVGVSLLLRAGRLRSWTLDRPEQGG
jgi:hypothetical protein